MPDALIPSPTPRRRPRTLLLPAVAAAAALAAAGCAPESPEERVAELRSRYTAELNSFVIEETPLVPEPMEGMEEGAGEEGAGEEETAPEEPAAGEEEMAEGEEEPLEPVPTRKDAVLDILIQNRAVEPLPGITLDIGLVNADKDTKETYRVWMDTSDLQKGRGQTYFHTLLDVPYEEGDAFYVEVRHPVPPAERGEYREFTETQPGA